ncbi:dihydroxyacetone kinase subunit DhaK [Cryobacterium sp. M91]|uniref:dihydroxyacetone kinase subunit DhaK n=1 Tax=Cryobacterium sp. M91 TaxID=2048294 RepID=UPI000CE47BDC|nr:dihydroxyacetone kinase subunit DhaK [Cryobacterium sp. M91]
MQKIINRPDDFVDEVLEGILAAHPGELKSITNDKRVLVRPDAPLLGRVGIVTGGGSGHLPLFLGYVGKGLCSAVAVGNVFSSPSVEQILEATRFVDGKAGVLYIYGNYGGDVLNFDQAAEAAAEEEIAVRTVVVTDDLASAPFDRRETRRGVAGLVFAYKVAGAAAERGASLQEVTEIATHAVNRMASFGVGLSPAILPAAGKPTFTLKPGEMEIGIGIHGERGTRRTPLLDADSITTELFQGIADDLKLENGDSIAVLINGLGSTPLEELYLMFRRLSLLAADAGLKIERSYIGDYSTSLEMAGASITVLHLDDVLRPLLADEALSPFIRSKL